jgi:hypothetical protein
MTTTELRCHAASSTQTHLTGVRPRELLCSESGVLMSWDSMVVETYIGMLEEKLKYISTLLRFDTSIDALFGA